MIDTLSCRKNLGERIVGRRCERSSRYDLHGQGDACQLTAVAVADRHFSRVVALHEKDGGVELFY